MHGNEDGTIPATFSVIFMVSVQIDVRHQFELSQLRPIVLIAQQIGWKPAESQPKPLKRGSGQMNLKDVLGNEDPEPKS